MATLVLGGNAFEQSAMALVVAGKDVFRLSPRGSDGALLADFELCDDAGVAVAKVVRGAVVGSAGVVARHGATFCEVVDARGTVIGRAEEDSAGVLRLTGTFGQAGAVVTITADALTIAKGSIRGCRFKGFETPVEIDAQGRLVLGTAPVAPARPGFRQKMMTPVFKQQGKRRR
jgi:hypothetical protein